MKPKKLEFGDVVQINPEMNDKFPGMLVVVTEPKEWGCQGYLMHTGDFHAVRFEGKAFIRPRFEEIEFVGKIEWMHGESEDTEETADEQ
jgi:hypothetical protein